MLPRPEPAADVSASRAAAWRHRAAISILVIAVVAAYANSLGGPFVFDDVSAVAENAALRSVASALDPAQGGVTTSGRPLLSLSFALNRAGSGPNVAGYHITNLIVHALAALTLFGMLRRTLRSPRLRLRPPSAAESLALAIAVAWAVHPLQTEAVTYIVQRAESLAGLFYFATLYGLCRAGEVPRPNRWLAVSVAGCVAGMATKEVLVTAPVVALLYDRTFWSGTFRNALAARPAYYATLAGTWLVFGALVLAAGDRGGTFAIGRQTQWFAYPLTQFPALTRYLALTAWPHPLVFDYGTFWITSRGAIAVPATFIVLTVTATIWGLRHNSVFGFLGAVFFLVLAPTSLAPGTLQMIVEHRMYLPSAALIAGALAGVQRLAGHRALLAVASAGGALLILTHARNNDYRSERRIWTDTVAKRPRNALAHTNLGRTLQDSGELDAAIAHYRIALEREPRAPETHNNLGEALRSRGELDGAIAEFHRALELRPSFAEAHNNLGAALRQAGQFEAAMAELRDALNLKPHYSEAHNNLGVALQAARRWPEARREFEQAIALTPEFAEAHSNLAVTLHALGDAQAALREFQTAVRLAPERGELHFNAALLLRELGRTDEARAAYQRARALRPDVPPLTFAP